MFFQCSRCLIGTRSGTIAFRCYRHFIGTLPAKGNHEAACMKLFRKMNKKKICIKNIGILRCEAEITAREMQIANLDLLKSAR